MVSYPFGTFWAILWDPPIPLGSTQQRPPLLVLATSFCVRAPYFSNLGSCEVQQTQSDIHSLYLFIPLHLKTFRAPLPKPIFEAYFKSFLQYKKPSLFTLIHWCHLSLILVFRISKPSTQYKLSQGSCSCHVIVSFLFNGCKPYFPT